jgi:hypothetical protein
MPKGCKSMKTNELRVRSKKYRNNKLSVVYNSSTYSMRAEQWVLDAVNKLNIENKKRR